jgi:thioredoxin 1
VIHISKSTIIISTIVIAIALVGFFAYTSSQGSDSESLSNKNDTSSQEIISDEMVSEDSRYKIYESQKTLDEAYDTRRVLYFYASWCPTCIPADRDFKENADKIPEDVTLIRVNYSDPDTDQNEKDLAKKYGVTYQHTFVQIDENGEEVTKWNGGQMLELLANIK